MCYRMRQTGISPTWTKVCSGVGGRGGMGGGGGLVMYVAVLTTQKNELQEEADRNKSDLDEGV